MEMHFLSFLKTTRIEFGYLFPSCKVNFFPSQNTQVLETRLKVLVLLGRFVISDVINEKLATEHLSGTYSASVCVKSKFKCVRVHFISRVKMSVKCSSLTTSDPYHIPG